LYLATKTFPPISCCFRNWRSKSHCRFLHGYAIEIKITFCSDSLNTLGWVIDFGSMKDLKKLFEDQFDHRTIIARDDPMMEIFIGLETEDIIQLNILPFSGSCELLADHITNLTGTWLNERFPDAPVKIGSVEVREHGANSAIYIGE
jgi:6-pyruvoyltetrahydropterin/6-carboxytetrahydropterin synthase